MTIHEGHEETRRRHEKAGKKEEEADWREAAWNQRFISGYGRMLPAKPGGIGAIGEGARPPAALPAPKADAGKRRAIGRTAEGVEASPSLPPRMTWISYNRRYIQTISGNS